ncbi:MAG: hypothetical protein V7771_14210 [Shewanella psychromarinicola]
MNNGLTAKRFSLLPTALSQSINDNKPILGQQYRFSLLTRVDDDLR